MNKLIVSAPETLKESSIITLDGSKSISNRIQIIRALSKEQIVLHNLSKSDDSDILGSLLQHSSSTLDAGHAGTTYRFMTAYLSMQKGVQVLTGSKRMKQRPIGPLVDALTDLGANIEYLEKPGFPPLKIGEFNKNTGHNVIKLPGGISSQYITALLLIAPCIENGLKIHIQGQLVSRPYVEMTLRIMEEFGVKHIWEGSIISIEHQNYKGGRYTIESDWSAASYYYSIVNLFDHTKLGLKGLFKNSLQGDAAILKIGTDFSIQSNFDEEGILWLEKTANSKTRYLEYDLLKTPDLAQTVSVMGASSGFEILFSGLQTLKIKETDRIAALQNELSKFGVYFSKLPDHFSRKSSLEYYLQNGKAKSNKLINIQTYKDHRMAMAFTPLCKLHSLAIEDPLVVNKSYPAYWNDLEKIGFIIEKLNH